MSIDSSNTHVIEYLKWYLSLPKAPNFAVLVKGPWGCGKSFLVREFLKSQEPIGLKHLYVSLYGLSVTTQIDDRIFEQLHPFFASKPARVIGSVLRSVAKVSIGIDINGDKKSDGQVNANLPDIDLASVLNNAKDRILVFDDLERTNIDASEVLGYINYFVEQHGAKCIVIANDNEIGVDELSKSKYRKIKEKLIGQELGVHPNLRAAFSNFIEETHNTETKSLLKENIKLAMEIFEMSGIQNLRSMRQAFLGIDRLLPALPKYYREHKVFCNDLLKTYLAFSLEVQSGNMRSEDISQLGKAPIDTDDELASLSEIIKKYRAINLTSPIFGGEQWRHILSEGWIQKEPLSNWLSQSIYANRETMPDWVQLRYFIDLPQQEFQQLEQRVWKKFEGGHYESIQETLRIAELLLFFSQEHITNRSITQIKEVAQAKIRALMTTDYVVKTFDPNEWKLPHDQFSKLRSGINAEGYSDLLILTRKLSEERWREYLPTLGKQLTQMMKTNSKEFRASIVSRTTSAELFPLAICYFRFPALSAIDVEVFINALMQKPTKERLIIGNALRDRYDNLSRFTEGLKEELPFLHRLQDALSARKTGIGLEQYASKTFNDNYVKFAIRKLEEYDPVKFANQSEIERIKSD